MKNNFGNLKNLIQTYAHVNVKSYPLPFILPLDTYLTLMLMEFITAIKYLIVMMDSRAMQIPNACNVMKLHIL